MWKKWRTNDRLAKRVPVGVCEGNVSVGRLKYEGLLKEKRFGCQARKNNRA